MRALVAYLRFRRARGQTIVLFALMSLVLIGGMGLVIDAGVDYTQRRIMQNAADTATLAGARIIARQSTFVVNRGQVWDAVFAVAVANGVANDPSRFDCLFVNNSRVSLGVSCNVPTGSDRALSPPAGAVGVRLRVREEHNTFFMRALGIPTSSTAAVSMAQVQAATLLPTGDTIFAICGVRPKVYGGGIANLLLPESYPDPSASPSAVPATLWRVAEPAAIVPAAYTLDWNVRDGSGALVTNAAAPTFMLFSSGIEKCNSNAVLANWQGLVGQPTNQDYQMPTDGTGPAFTRPPVDIRTGVVPAGPGHTINGTLGCKKSQMPRQLTAPAVPTTATMADDGCIMLVPIVDNSDTTSLSGTPALIGRLWGTFYVFNQGGTYYGWLIKNYPIHAQGAAVWRTDYLGPITVTLVQAP